MTTTARPVRADTGIMLVVYTGGTFGMRDHGNGLEATANLESVLADLVGAAAPAPAPAPTPDQWRYLALERIIDSADADLAHALSIAALIRSHSAGARGVVVVHGTDTLAYVAAVVAFALADLDTPIVFTGAQRAVSEAASDAPANFIAAYREAAAGSRGVRIAFGGAVLPAVRAVKFSSTDDEAFVAHRPLASGAVGVQRYAGRLAELGSATETVPETALPRVGLLRVFPGFAPELLRTAAQLYPDGLVLECYGAGTAPMSTRGMGGAVRETTEAGTPVVAITQCSTGSVDIGRYSVGAALQRAGAWDGRDLTAEAALAKLGLLAALDLDAAELRSAFRTNLIGEQSEGA